MGGMASNEAKLAHQVLAENLKVRPGESVVIESWTHTLPWTGAFVAETRRLGAHPVVTYEDESAWWETVRGGDTRVLSRMSAAEKALLASADVFVYFWGPEDRPRVDRLPDKVQSQVTAWNEDWYKIAGKAGVRGCRMTLGQATDPVARTFGLNGPSWRRRLLAAGLADGAAMRKRGYALARKLEIGSELRIQHPNGTDLTLHLGKVHTRVDSGITDAAAMARPYGMLANNPTGQVMAAIDDSRAEGTFVSNRPVYLGSNRFDGIRWNFSDGQLTSRKGGEGADLFEKEFAGAPKGRDRLGYLSLGLNPAGRELPPCEDTEEGAALIGIGSNGAVGGKLRIPFQAYALIGDATISIDGRTIAKAGKVR